MFVVFCAYLFVPVIYLYLMVHGLDLQVFSWEAFLCQRSILPVKLTNLLMDVTDLVAES